MKPSHHTKKIIFLAFLLSLLFHFGSIIFVAIASLITHQTEKSQHDQSPIAQPIENTQKINKQSNEWVETKARAGDFGTPVFFQDDFEPASAETVTDKSENSLKEVMQDTSEEPSSLQEEPHIKEAMEIPEKENIVTQKPQSTSITSESEIKPKKQAIQKKSSPIKQSPKPVSAPSSAKATAGGPKPPITLSQLTQGFLNHVKDEGKHSIHMLGKKSGTPSDEQLKYERYLQKLSWCLQNSFNIHNDRFPSSAHRDDEVQVLLSLNKDGSMKHCHVAKTSGNRDLDYFTLFIFNDASSSFPPVPQYLPHDPFTINYVIMVSTSQENRFKLYRQ